ncbi:MAG: UDP-N-acetylmuramate dehydrogenase [Gammaproteobacteria bacterium]
MSKHSGDNGFANSLRRDEPMAARTSWRAGGKADQFYLPADTDELIALLHALPEQEQLYWMGLGSNLLVRDGGVRGTVICLTEMPHLIEQQADGSIYLSAATPCAKVARTTAARGLGGAEFMAGIPGTVGGALAMNAGAWGTETWQIVERAEMINRQGVVSVSPATDFKPAYRQVETATDGWFTGAYVRLAETDSGVAQQRISDLLKERAASQPLGKFSCGSVFRNPDNDHAARLIEACGLKGHAIGGAVVSEKHANFIVNTGQATAADIESLIDHIRSVVNDKFNIDLIPEVKIIGEAVRQ